MKHLVEELYKMVCPHENALELAANWSSIGNRFHSKSYEHNKPTSVLPLDMR